MADEKMYTERDIVMAKREAWVECDMEFVRDLDPIRRRMRDASEAEARKRFPLSVKRPRVVTAYDPKLQAHIEARYVDGVLAWRRKGEEDFRPFDRAAEYEFVLAERLLSLRDRPDEDVPE